ncbi:hypothetical protein MRY82_06330 [bacterium]|nr:hypothetical protein [bacterium]
MRCLKKNTPILFFLSFGFFIHSTTLHAHGFGKATAVCHPHNIYQFEQLHIPYFTYYKISSFISANNDDAILEKWLQHNRVETFTGEHAMMLPKECVVSAIQACQALGIAAFWMNSQKYRTDPNTLSQLIKEFFVIHHPFSPVYFSPDQSQRVRDFPNFDHLDQYRSQFSIHLTHLTCSQTHEFEDVKQEQLAMPVISKKANPVLDENNRLNYEALSAMSDLELAERLNQEIEQAQSNGILILIDQEDIDGAPIFAISDHGVDILYPLAKNIRAYRGIASIKNLVQLVDAAIEQGMQGRYTDWLKLKQQRSQAKAMALSFGGALMVVSGGGTGALLFSSMRLPLDDQVNNNPSSLYHLKSRPQIVKRILAKEHIRKTIVHYTLLLNAANHSFKCP